MFRWENPRDDLTAYVEYKESRNRYQPATAFTSGGDLVVKQRLTCRNPMRVMVPSQDGFALILMARVVTITSLGPLLAAANGMGETIWPSKRWQEVWIVSIIFLLASLAGFLTLSLMLRDFGLLTLGCIMATGASYAGALWLVAMYKVKFPRFFGQNAAGPIAAGCLVGSYLFLGFADLTCGPPGHADCYARCFVPEGGLHYLIWMGAAQWK